MVKVPFKCYLKRNQFEKNVNVALKYLRRYDVEKFDDKGNKFKRITNQKSVSRQPPLYEFQKIKYYFDINKFRKNANTTLKYLKRYDISKFNNEIRRFQKITRKKSVSIKQPLYEYQKGNA